MPAASSPPLSVSQHTLRQLKFVIPGGAITYYLRTYDVFWRILEGELGDGWGRCVRIKFDFCDF